MAGFLVPLGLGVRLIRCPRVTSARQMFLEPIVLIAFEFFQIVFRFERG